MQLACKLMKRCSTLLVTREMQITTTMRYHLTPTTMVIIKKIDNKKCWQDCREIKTFIHCLWECKVVQQLWKRVWHLFKKLNMTPHNSTIPLLDMYPRELEYMYTHTHTHTHTQVHMNIHSSSIHNSQKVETTQISDE